MSPLLFDQCRAYLIAQGFGDASKREKSPLRAVTISRETGAGAISIGQLVAENLESNQGGNNHQPWAVFDRDLVKRVLADHQLPENLAKYMPEDITPGMNDFLEDLLGLHPSSWTLVQKTNHTILQLAKAGNVILVGRGAHLITAQLKHVFHVRLIAPLDLRIRRIADYYHLNHQEAAEFVRKEDRAKARYILRNFESRIQDPLQFHVTLNTGLLSFNETARMISDAVWNMPVHSFS